MAVQCRSNNIVVMAQSCPTGVFPSGMGNAMVPIHQSSKGGFRKRGSVFAVYSQMNW